MELESMRLLAKSIIIISMLATAPAEGYIIGKAFEAMGRNPEISDSLFTKMIIGVAMAESTAIYAWLHFLSFKNAKTVLILLVVVVKIYLFHNIVW